MCIFLKDNTILSSFIMSIQLTQCALFIQLYTSLIPLSKATGLYMIIWQILYYAVKYSLSIIYRTLQIGCQCLMKIVFTSHGMKSITFLKWHVSKIHWLYSIIHDINMICGSDNRSTNHDILLLVRISNLGDHLKYKLGHIKH